MDVFSSGPNLGNLLVTLGLVVFLLVMSSRTKMLDAKGANAAAMLGLIVGGLGHWTWLLVLLGFLLGSHKATKWRFEEKKALGLSESSDGHRGWTNVVANGAIPGLICLYAYLSEDWETVVWLFGAAVAVAASDTFASEIGCLDTRVRMITTLKPCKQGENGGFSPNGQLAAAVGSAVVAVLTLLTWWLTTPAASVADGLQMGGVLAFVGWLGCQIDSYLGALLENRGYMSKGAVNASAITGGVLLMATYMASL
ncbi:MAG TPA: DUF92 domain-containing protein [Candidatus Poseidoniales archaeon]|nr:MAG TPA: DUF92 domain-containing protein [Candidatus Poseidoniales archaeon]|tara:strand:- start:79 stop:840 length:762 start_codon:yes stop_codon:yes gene_type:complete